MCPTTELFEHNSCIFVLANFESFIDYFETFYEGAISFVPSQSNEKKSLLHM